MLLQEQRELVVEYGKKLVTTGLTDGTFGNLSVFDRQSGLMAISPSAWTILPPPRRTWW